MTKAKKLTPITAKGPTRFDRGLCLQCDTEEQLDRNPCGVWCHNCGYADPGLSCSTCGRDFVNPTHINTETKELCRVPEPEDAPTHISPEHLELHRLNIGRMNRITELEQEAAMLKAVVGAWMQDMKSIYHLGDTDGIDNTGAILRAPQQTVDT